MNVRGAVECIDHDSVTTMKGCWRFLSMPKGRRWRTAPYRTAQVRSDA